MVLLYIYYLMFAGLLGIHCGIITVSKVLVKKGGSVSIPCYYEPPYRNHVKYLCKGYLWISCTTIIKTNQLKTSEKFSISDDTNQRIFTVTINDLTVNDKNFWCAIEILNGKDVKQYFQLSVSTGTKSLNVTQQEIVAFEGGSVTVVCHNKYPEEKGVMWCGLGNICVTDQVGSIDGTTVKINMSVPNIFTVTMSDLRTESSGWYWCAVGDLQMPVHIIVHKVTSTTTDALHPNTNFTRTLSTVHQRFSLLTSTEPNTVQPTNSSINRAKGGSLEDKYKSSSKVTILFSVLILQLLIIIVTLFGRKMIMCKNTRPEVCDITVGSQTTYHDMLYCDDRACHDEQVTAQTKDNFPTESVKYSTIVIKDNVQHMSGPADRKVIYSTLKFSKPQ